MFLMALCIEAEKARVIKEKTKCIHHEEEFEESVSLPLLLYNLLCFEVGIRLTLGFLETLLHTFFSVLSQSESFLNSLHTQRVTFQEGEHGEIHTVLPIRISSLRRDYFLISNSSSMPHIS